MTMITRLLRHPSIIKWRRHSLHTSASLDKNNIMLMGSPGSGKTTVGQLLGLRLGRKVVDIDNDFLEKKWGMSVSKKLSELGAEGFLEAEGEAMTEFYAEDSIVALTGSVPMHKEGFEHVRKLGTLVFLDILGSDIEKRLARMKVGRIVGQAEGMPMSEILQYRQQFYEGHYDIRVICHEGETPGTITDKIIRIIKGTEKRSKYVSTRGAYKDFDTYGPAPTFNQVVLRGLAPDGGLYVPEHHMPAMTIEAWQRLVPLPYHERALRILEQWIHRDDIHPSVLRQMVNSTYNKENFCNDKVCPVSHLYENIYVCELFHGPTASFKDSALQLMPKFFQHALDHRVKPEHRYCILVATSGDTGGAVLDGFGKLGASGSVDVIVLYPEKGISSVQKAQMINARGDNVHVVGVRSDFDFCQFAIKRIFKDKDFCGHIKEQHGTLLSAANSLNWGRLLPQVVHHASSYLDLVDQGVIVMGDPVDLCVPTGNFGNILAAYYAKQMGIPLRTLICASNANNVLTEFFHSGTYSLQRRNLRNTSSPAIDILKSSNVERFLYHMSGEDHLLVHKCMNDLDTQKYFTVPKQVLRQLRDIVLADWCTEKDCHRMIEKILERTGYLMDPHTAVGMSVANRLNNKDCPLLVASTAHYSKFAEDILTALDNKPPLNNGRKQNAHALCELLSKRVKRPGPHEVLLDTISRTPVHNLIIDANVNVIQQEIEAFLQRRLSN